MNERFIITIQAAPDDRPVAIRLRQWLKIGLRGMKLRCIRIEPATEVTEGYRKPLPLDLSHDLSSGDEHAAPVVEVKR